MSEHDMMLEVFESFEYREPVLSEAKKRELREYFEDMLFPFGKIVLDPCLCEKENS
jgi:hypothetical protein